MRGRSYLLKRRVFIGRIFCIPVLISKTPEYAPVSQFGGQRQRLFAENPFGKPEITHGIVERFLHVIMHQRDFFLCRFQINFRHVVV